MKSHQYDIEVVCLPSEPRGSLQFHSNDDSITEDMKLMDDKIGLLIAAKYETEKLLESLIEKYHGNETFKKNRGILGDIFKYEAKDSGTSNDDCREPNNKMNDSGTSSIGS
ncbi:hypothetical protein L6452_40809 [Arctium lappa]|uniref:Uncharacterized protein n=1 Tax=Arctium lappa TaxID=4217 RepID=A0ACB8XMX6_ARCLA|nr:hypothetical protein L6452_40809 [Arctium lappa]